MSAADTKFHSFSWRSEQCAISEKAHGICQSYFGQAERGSEVYWQEKKTEVAEEKAKAKKAPAAKKSATAEKKPATAAKKPAAAKKAATAAKKSAVKKPAAKKAAAGDEGSTKKAASSKKQTVLISEKQRIRIRLKSFDYKLIDLSTRAKLRSRNRIVMWNVPNYDPVPN